MDRVSKSALRLLSVMVVACGAYSFQATAEQTLTPSGEPPAIDRPLPNTPLKSELDKVFERLANEVKKADALVEHLRSTAQATPESTRIEINKAADLLGGLADRLQPKGDVATQLQALRNAAVVHRKRVAELPQGAMPEQDRNNILSAWDKTIQDADKGGAAIADMRSKIMATLEKLRMRQTAISELMLAGQYQAAVDTLKRWLDDLAATVSSLHTALGTVVPSS